MDAKHRRAMRFRPVRILAIIVFAGFIGWTVRALAVLFGVPAGWRWASDLAGFLTAALVVSLTASWWLYASPEAPTDHSQRSGGN